MPLHGHEHADLTHERPISSHPLVAAYRRAKAILAERQIACDRCHHFRATAIHVEAGGAQAVCPKCKTELNG
jgi:hypothetical protein